MTTKTARARYDALPEFVGVMDANFELGGLFSEDHDGEIDEAFRGHVSPDHAQKQLEMNEISTVRGRRVRLLFYVQLA